jgi:hypothetical protein
MDDQPFCPEVQVEVEETLYDISKQDPSGQPQSSNAKHFKT